MTKQLKRENDSLKKQIEELTREISNLKESVHKADSSGNRHSSDEANLVTRSNEVNASSNDVQFLSDEYDDLNNFRCAAIKQLEEIEKKLQKIGKRVEELASAIDAAEIYSYQYNQKIVACP